MFLFCAVRALFVGGAAAPVDELMEVEEHSPKVNFKIKCGNCFEMLHTSLLANRNIVIL